MYNVVCVVVFLDFFLVVLVLVGLVVEVSADSTKEIDFKNL